MTSGDLEVQVDEATGCRIEVHGDVVALTWPTNRPFAVVREQFRHSVDESLKQDLDPDVVATIETPEGDLQHRRWLPSTAIDDFLPRRQEECEFLRMDIDECFMVWYRACPVFPGQPTALGYALSNASRLRYLQLLLVSSLGDQQVGHVDRLVSTVANALRVTDRVA
jgi:hypothetical protein